MESNFYLNIKDKTLNDEYLRKVNKDVVLISFFVLCTQIITNIAVGVITALEGWNEYLT
jgi:hypothetical protein